MQKKSVWNTYTKTQLTELEQLAKDYRHFLNVGKTERECVKETMRLAEAHGYENLDDITARQGSLKAGDKVYAVNMNKEIALFTIGSKPLENGMRILGAHIDSPRLDLKQNPL